VTDVALAAAESGQRDRYFVGRHGLPGQGAGRGDGRRAEAHDTKAHDVKAHVNVPPGCRGDRIPGWPRQVRAGTCGARKPATPRALGSPNHSRRDVEKILNEHGSLRSVKRRGNSIRDALTRRLDLPGSATGNAGAAGGEGTPRQDRDRQALGKPARGFLTPAPARHLLTLHLLALRPSYGFNVPDAIISDGNQKHRLRL
jgi:hypothetical protein